jgi:hypothetical protein
MRAGVGLVKRVDMLRVMEGGALDMTMFKRCGIWRGGWDLSRVAPDWTILCLDLFDVTWSPLPALRIALWKSQPVCHSSIPLCKAFNPGNVSSHIFVFPDRAHEEHRLCRT